jgi:hypothetical protein
MRDDTKRQFHIGSWIGLTAFFLVGLGCETGLTEPQETTPLGQSARERRDSRSKETNAGSSIVDMGKNVWLEVDGDKRRVIVQAEVCLRDGMLEHLMCRKRTKEHEAILAADVDARDIHKALILAKATPGTTVKYTDNGVILPTGTRIKITLKYKDKDKEVTVPGKDWVRDVRTKKSLEHDWVFAGSSFQPNPLEKDKPPLYMANGGDVICVSNFGEAMLDLPINSSKNNAELEFEAFTDRIPPIETPVTVILEPVLEAKKLEKEKDLFKARQEGQKEKKIDKRTSPPDK